METSARGRDPAVEEEFLGSLYKGGELLASGKVVEAREHLERANALQPKNEKAQNLLGLTYFKLGLYEQASAVYERLVNENPADATLRVNLGLVFLKTNDLERCVREFEIATDLEPTHKKAHNYLGLALAQQGHYEKAREHFVLAGSEQMAEKMARALAAQRTANDAALPVPQEAHARPQPPPLPARPPPLPGARGQAEEAPIEVMSEDDPPPDAAQRTAPEVSPATAAALATDWSAQLPGGADDSPPLEGAVDVAPTEPLPQPPTAATAPDWLTTSQAPASEWVTESVADVPYSPPSPAPQAAPVEAWSQSPQWTAGAEATEPPPEGTWQESPPDAGWGTAVAPQADWTTGSAAPAAVPTEAPPAEAAWAAAQPQSASQAPVVPQPDDDSWATGGTAAATVTEAAPAPAPAPEETEPWAVGPPEAAVQPELIEKPAPSAPIPIEVETSPAPRPSAPPAAPAGYAPMKPQRLVDLGASGAWVREPRAGPFHISAEGLAVTVAGEMLLRMEGLVAVVGSLEVRPEFRRRRGRPTGEPFGEGPAQLQRVTGDGVVYLEPGKATFHAVDLTDQGGVSVDDEGAYLREELVFAFEEPISYENGRLSNDSQVLELVHLKGTGRALVQLEGNLRAMPIPLGAPLVVPLQRLVGWFGRVTPRLMGFGGRGAIELTGEGYALLGTPAERA